MTRSFEGRQAQLEAMLKSANASPDGCHLLALAERGIKNPETLAPPDIQSMCLLAAVLLLFKENLIEISGLRADTDW